MSATNAWPRMDDAGVNLEVLPITTGTQSLPAEKAVLMAHEANDFLADSVRRRPDRFAAFAARPTPVNGRIILTRCERIIWHY
jgi:predicted TIM-barrel fold metal-dependent hydrolase